MGAGKSYSIRGPAEWYPPDRGVDGSGYGRWTWKLTHPFGGQRVGASRVGSPRGGPRSWRLETGSFFGCPWVEDSRVGGSCVGLRSWHLENHSFALGPTDWEATGWGSRVGLRLWVGRSSLIGWRGHGLGAHGLKAHGSGYGFRAWENIVPSVGSRVDSPQAKHRYGNAHHIPPKSQSSFL